MTTSEGIVKDHVQLVLPSSSPPQSKGNSISRISWILCPYLIAAVFALWGLHGASGTDIPDSDAARHAMNGVFFRDLVHEGHLHDPVAYGKWYYAHFPSLSLPYHPPLFPIFEAVLFAMTGVSVFSARLAISLFTFAAAVLLYRLVQSTHSRALALIAVPAFFAIPLSRSLASEIMLEMPALAFVVAAVYVIRDLEFRFSIRTGILFALLASAGVWTKQTVFLALIPFVLALVARKLRLFAAWKIWVSCAVIAVATVGLLSLSVFIHSTGMNQTWPHRTLNKTMTANWAFYYDSSCIQIGVAATLLLGILVPVLLFSPDRFRQPFRRDYLYVSWLIAEIAVILPLGAFDERYLFFAYPPMIVLICSALFFLSQKLLPGIPQPVLPAVLVFGWLLFFSHSKPNYLAGPSQVAETLTQAHASRILYCGRSDGSFIFAWRSLHSLPNTTVIRGDKLPADTFAGNNIEQFANRYGVEYVVMEKTAEDQPWNSLHPDSGHLLLKTTVPLLSSRPRRSGYLSVYRLAHPTSHPEDRLDMHISVLNQDMEFSVQ